MELILSATLSRLNCVQGDFRMSTDDTLVQNFYLLRNHGSSPTQRHFLLLISHT